MIISILGAATASLIGFGAVESFVHRRRLKRIPIRIHVAGTRGKSSVTRLVAAGLRAGGIRTVAKTTGTQARLILPDASEINIPRSGPPSILEQSRVVKAASLLDAKALVVECMALQPELHWISERMLIRATHGVITNVHKDHLDVMGPEESDVACALAGVTPIKGMLISAEEKYHSVFEFAASDRKTKYVSSANDNTLQIDQGILDRFPYIEHPENVRLALVVTRALNIKDEDALKGMQQAIPDPGALTESVVDFFGRRIVFINGFAANDPQSTEIIWQLSCKRHDDVERIIAVFNLRHDRPARTLQMARDTNFWHNAHRVVLIGDGANLFAHAVAKTGFDTNRLVILDNKRAAEIFETIVGLAGPSALIIGMANIAGIGLELSEYFQHRINEARG